MIVMKATIKYDNREEQIWPNFWGGWQDYIAIGNGILSMGDFSWKVNIGDILMWNNGVLLNGKRLSIYHQNNQQHVNLDVK